MATTRHLSSIKRLVIDKETKNALIEEDPRSAEIIKPVLQGRDIGRYYLGSAEKYLIATLPSKKISIDEYPAIKSHLFSFGQNRLEQSGRILSDGTRARKYTPHRWYELQDTCAYYEEFEKEKIAYSDISISPQFHLDRNGIYFTNTAYILTGNHLKFLIGVLNSNFFTYIFRKFYAGGGLGDHGYRYFKIFLESVPIPTFSRENLTIKNQIENLVELMINTVNENQKNEILDDQLNQLIYRYYDLTPREIDVVIE